MATDITQPVAAIMADLISNASSLVSRAATADSLNSQLASDKAAALSQLASLSSVNAQLASDKAGLLATTSSQSIVIAGLHGQVAELQAEITTLQGQIGSGTPAPTPTAMPAPIFTVQPSIDGTPQVGQILTGMDGTITNGTVVSRRWLLGAAVVSTAQTYMATAAGALVYEVTAQGSGGTTVASSAAITVAAVSTGARRMLGPIGVNPDDSSRGSDGPVSPWLNLARGSRDWITDFGNDPATGQPWADPTLNAARYPVVLNPHKASAFTLINFPGPYDTSASTKHYILETNNPTIPLSLDGWTNTVTSVANGVRRITFDLADSALNNGISAGAFETYLRVGAAFADGDYVDIFDARDEAALKSGLQIRQQWVDRTVQFGGGIRFLDWCHPNAHLDMSGYPPIKSWTWVDRVPLDVLIECCNRTNQNMWYLFPVNTTDDQFAAITITALAGLNANLSFNPEYGNEVWNFQFAGTGEVYNKRKQDNGQPYDYNVNYGYFAAQMAAMCLKASGYSDRCRPILSSQAYVSSVTDRELIGVGQRLAELKAAGGDLARFTEPGQLFAYLAVATYLAAGLDDPNMSAADLATVKSWANEADGGTAKVIDQITYGNLIADPSGQHLDNWTALYASQKAIADRLQMRLVAYEGMPVLQASADGVLPIWKNAIRSAAWRGVMTAWLDACLNAGFDAVMLEGDIGNFENDYALVNDPNKLNTNRWLGVMDAVANPAAPAALAISLTANGSFKVGQRPTVRVATAGGRGEATLSVKGMLPGQAYDGFRTIGGELTQEVDAAVTLTVTATDETGATASATLEQTVGAAPVYKAGRYLSVQIFNPGDYVEVDYLGIIGPDGTEHGAAWSGSGRIENLAAADGNNTLGDPNGTVGIGDMGASYQVAQVVVVRGGNDYHCPLKISVSLGSKADGSDGVTLITQVDPDKTAWQAAGLRRVFNVPG